MTTLAHTHITYDHARHPRKGEMTFTERRRFGPMACRWLESIGAIRSDFYDYAIETTYGTLRVTPYDNWVACRFDNAELARPIVGPSFTAKWNHYHFDVSPAGERPTAAELLELFAARLRPILARKI